MAEDYTILAAEGTKEWQGKDGGTLVDHSLLIKRVRDGEEMTVTMCHRPETAPAAVGTVVNGDITENKFGKKLKKAWDGGGGGGGGFTSGSSFNGNGGGGDRGKDIRRSVALKAAVELAIADGTPNVATVARITNELEEILINAPARPANPTSSPEHPTTLMDVPVSTNGNGADPDQDDSIPF